MHSCRALQLGLFGVKKSFELGFLTSKITSIVSFWVIARSISLLPFCLAFTCVVNPRDSKNGLSAFATRASSFWFWFLRRFWR